MSVASIDKPLSIVEAEGLAEKVRETYWRRRSIPIDPVAIGKAMGIRIYDAELPTDVAGAFLKRIGEDPVILLRNDDSLNRKRFTCAHEIGHYVYRFERDHFIDQELDFVDKRDSMSSIGEDSEEISANRFAAALLMPEKEIKSHPDSKNVYALSEYFNVSLRAMGYRLNALKRRN